MGSFFYCGKLSVAEGKEKKDEEKKIFGAFSVCGNGCRPAESGAELYF